MTYLENQIKSLSYTIARIESDRDYNQTKVERWHRNGEKDFPPTCLRHFCSDMNVSYKQSNAYKCYEHAMFNAGAVIWNIKRMIDDIKFEIELENRLGY